MRRRLRHSRSERVLALTGGLLLLLLLGFFASRMYENRFRDRSILPVPLSNGNLRSWNAPVR